MLPSILEQYESRSAIVEDDIAKLHRQKSGLMSVLVLCVLVSVAALLLSVLKVFLALGFIACLLIWQHHQVRKRWCKAGRERDYYRRGVDRLNRRWDLLEDTGEEYREVGHPYQDDLSILGFHSLFQMLCSVRTRLGAEHLAKALLKCVPSSESVSRQACVKELVSRSDLREATALLGKTSVVNCSTEDVMEWLSMPLLKTPRALYPFLVVCATLTCLLSLGVYSKALDWHASLPCIAGLCIPLLLSAARFRSAVIDRLTVLRPIAGSFGLLLDGTKLLERQEFSSENLREGVNRLRSDQASRHLKQLARIFGWLEQREKPYFFFTIFIALGTLIVFRTERWKEQHGASIREWLNVWGTFEALQALACCAYEHPEWTFPDLNAAPTSYQAAALGHPLLSTELCVRNDVFLGQGQRYLFVSGSNMAGKSTLLRAIGLNAVLAYAGGPVCAESLTLTQMHLYASIAVQDDLSGGTSRFMAEVRRIASAMTASRQGKPVLFLVDEILSGTNSEDRRFVANAFLTQVLLGDALGVLTSHDLSLVTDLPTGSVWHMASCHPSHPLQFDYKLKAGLVEGSNGVALARLAGILD